MRQIIKILLLITLVLIIGFTCKKSPTEPELQPGRRDYTWTVDTIKAYFLNLYGIWGDSPNNVWAAGQGSSTENIWNYDGRMWLNRSEGSNWSPWGVFGFGNDVWFANYNQTGFIVHYNGQSFTREYELKYDGYETGLIDIYGLSKNDIYAVGTKMINNYKEHDGVICHYDGKSWGVKKIIENGGNLIKINYSPRNDKYYILCNYFPDTVSIGQRIYEYDENNLIIIHEKLVTDETLCSFNTIQEDIYIIIGKKIYRYVNNKFELMFELDDLNFGYQIYGRNEKDLIIRMQDGLAHYNGQDVKYILKLQQNMNSGFTEVFENEIFTIVHDGNSGRELIYHGKLK